MTRDDVNIASRAYCISRRINSCYIILSYVYRSSDDDRKLTDVENELLDLLRRKVSLMLYDLQQTDCFKPRR